MGKCRKTAYVLAVSLALSCSLYRDGQAQFAVYDTANHQANLLTGFQSTITAAQSVLQTGYMVLELTGLDSNPLGSDFGVDIAELSAIIGETQAILFDLETIRNQTARIFGLQSAVGSIYELRERLNEIRRIRAEMLCRARDIQTLPLRIVNVVRRIQALWSRIVSVVGGTQNGQQIQASLQQLTHVEAQTQVIQAAYHQAVLTDMAERPVVEQSLTLINEQLMADWPQ